MDAACSWLLAWRNYQHHRTGQEKPPVCRKHFKTREAAFRELVRLESAPGAVIRGFVTAVARKPPAAEQIDFGFPLGGERRMTD